MPADEDDPFKGLPLEEPGWIERLMLKYPRTYFTVVFVGATSLSLGLIRPWEFW